MVFGVWPLTRMRVSESSSPNNIFSMNSMLDEAALPTTRAALSPHHSNARHHTGRRSTCPSSTCMLTGLPRERGPQKTQLIPLAPRGSSSDRQQPVGCLDPYPNGLMGWVYACTTPPTAGGHRSAGRHLPGLFAWYTQVSLAGKSWWMVRPKKNRRPEGAKLGWPPRAPL
jgi:hypothetical protein